MILWADGGLKTKEILYHFSSASQEHNLLTRCNYFASYHGHSVCDGHFGAGKTILRNSISLGVVENMDQVIESFNKVVNTEKGVYLGEIESQLPLVSPFRKKLKIYHLFCFSKQGEIWCKERWDSGDWILQKIKERNAIETEERKNKQDNRNQTEPLWKSTKQQLREAIGNRVQVPSNANKEELINIMKELTSDTPPNSQELLTDSQTSSYPIYNPLYNPVRPCLHQQFLFQLKWHLLLKTRQRHPITFPTRGQRENLFSTSECRQ